MRITFNYVLVHSEALMRNAIRLYIQDSPFLSVIFIKFNKIWELSKL